MRKGRAKIISEVGGDFENQISFRMFSTEASLLTMGADAIADYVATHFRSELRSYEIGLREERGLRPPIWLDRMRHCQHCGHLADESPSTGKAT